MKTYFVEWEEPCDACNETGIEQHFLWTVYWAETNGYRDLPPKEQAEADDKWWAERGYHGARNWPPEEVNCSYCDGAGIRRGRVSLTEALADMAGTAVGVGR